MGPMKTFEIFFHDKCGFGDFRLRDQEHKGVLLLPVRLLMLYLLFSIIAFIYGPFAWNVSHPIRFYGFLASYFFALWLGFRLGIAKRFQYEKVWTEEDDRLLIRLIGPLIAVNVVFYVIYMFRDYGLSSFDFPAFFRILKSGLMNPGYGYHQHYERLLTVPTSERLGGYYFSLVFIIWSCIHFPTVILSVFYFSRLKIYAKILVVFYFVMVFFHFLSIGTNIRVLHLILLFLVPQVLKYLGAVLHDQMTKKKLLKLLIMVCLCVLVMGLYFSWMMISRDGLDTENYRDGLDTENYQDGLDTENYQDGLDTENSELPTINVGGVGLKDGQRVTSLIDTLWIYASGYLTQGYYGMSLALQEPWIPMYGVGNSMYLTGFITSHITDIKQYSYQERIEKYGWDSDINWHTMFTWLANDVSFYGVAIVMLLIGFLAGAMYKDSIIGDNPFAKVGMYFFLLMALFIPCNNQLGQSVDTLVSFVFILLCWFVSKLYLRVKRTKA